MALKLSTRHENEFLDYTNNKAIKAGPNGLEPSSQRTRLYCRGFLSIFAGLSGEHRV